MVKFPGLISEQIDAMTSVYKLKLVKASRSQSALGRVELAEGCRATANRWDVVEIYCPGKDLRRTIAIVVGTSEEGVIKLDLDGRNELGLVKADIGQIHTFRIRKLRWYAAFGWLLTNNDPSVRLPVWLGVLSLILAVFSALLAFR